MYYGVSQSTDLRDRRTKILKFKTVESLRKWLSTGSGEFTYKNPEESRNYHHTYKSGYFVQGRIDFKDKIFKSSGTPTYRVTKEDNIATYLYHRASCDSEIGPRVTEIGV